MGINIFLRNLFALFNKKNYFCQTLTRKDYRQ